MSTEFPIVDTTELVRRLEGADPPLVLVVASEAEFRRRRIPGSHRFGEFEAVLAATVPTRSIVLSGRAAGSLASAWAFRLLREMGFSDVSLHDDGIDGWIAAGQPLESGPGQGEPHPLDHAH